MRPKIIFSLTFYPDTGVNPRRRRRRVMFVWALLPWLAIALAVALNFAVLGVKPTPGPHSGAMIILAMAWSAMGLTVAMLLDRFRESPALKPTILVSLGVLIVAAQIASLGGADTVVSMYRFIGPMGSISLELAFVISAFALLAWLSQKSGFPALGLVLLAILISALFPVPIQFTVVVLTVLSGVLAVMALLSGLRVVATLAMVVAITAAVSLERNSGFALVAPNPTLPDPCQSAAGSEDAYRCPIEQRFEAWLKARTAKQSPVFIFAVEGGGIYAAAAASLLLARLQDSAPDFSQHVFAISGVSGGAIGATIFQALDRSALENDPAGSPQNRGGPEPAASAMPNSVASRESDDCSGFATLQREVCNVMQDDHLSPVVASIFPEVFGARIKRAEALAASFEELVRSRYGKAAQELCDPFVDHWSQTGRAPALVLNTTWVETGFRAAFAPFSLHGSGDQSLYSFSDQYMPGSPASASNTSCDTGSNISSKQITLMDAAIDSARFPLILPAYSVEMEENPKGRYVRWNFVDGGYSDNSGASTALALYGALEPIAKHLNVDLELVLLTSSYSQPDLTPGRVKISGTQFRDTLAPIDAMLKVREGLGNAAVARASDYFKGKAAHLAIVQLNDRAFDLPLGWKLSPTSFNVVSWMLGSPEECSKSVSTQREPGVTQPASTSASRTNLEVQRDANSCAQKQIEDSLNAGQVTNAPAPARTTEQGSL